MLRELLLKEQQEDREQYRRLTERSPVAEKRANGLCWYPVAIRDTELTRGDYLAVELERTTHHDLPHQFRFGVPAALFSNHNASEHRLDGIVTHIAGNRLKITLRVNELPDWADDGKLGVDLLFDDNSYQEMFAALQTAANIAESGRESRLVEVLIGKRDPAFNKEIKQLRHSALNPWQQQAVSRILSMQDLAIVHGPPGTGKTTTIVEAVRQCVHQGSGQILVTAPSNAAVDLLTEKLSRAGMVVLRIGNPARVSESLMALTLDGKTATHPAMKEMRRLKKQANEFRNMAHKYKRNFGKAEREQRKALFDEAHKIYREVAKTEQYITDDLVSKAQVITSTLVGAAHFTIARQQFDLVVIDEAGQSLEPACWIPILKGKRVVLAGDPYQLPPTVKSNAGGRDGLMVSLLEKLIAVHPGSVTLLEEQYRMNRLIAGYPSEIFYQHRLKAHPSVEDHLVFPDDQPLMFVDTAGCGFEEKISGTAISNPEEAGLVIRLLAAYFAGLPQPVGIPPGPTVAVISPYRLQIEELNGQLQREPALIPYVSNMSINTIDSFQGQERDVVYISMTRSNADSRIGFLSDIRRMNVAMTRARKKLVVVGDGATLSQFPFYAGFIAYCERMNAYRSAWEFM